jgi:hypothetical protein
MAAGDNTLLFRIKVDPSEGVAGLMGFSNAVEKETNKVVQNFAGVTGAAGRLASSLGVVGLGAATLAGAFITAGGGIFEFAIKTSDAANDLYNFYQRTNVSVETLSALRVALKSSGSDLDRFQNGLIFFQKNVEKVNELVATGKDRNNDLAKSFKALSIDTSTNEKALLSAFAALSKLGEGTQQTALAQRLFRGSARDVLAVIKESHGDFDAYTEQLRKMGLIIGTDAARQAHDFNVQLQLLRLEAEASGRVIGQEVLPTITGAIEDMTGAMTGNKSILKSWGEDLRMVIQMIETVAEFLKKDPNDSFWSGPSHDFERFVQIKNRIQRRDDIAAGNITVTPDEMTPAQRAELQKKGNRELFNAQRAAGMKPDADLLSRVRGDIDPADLTGAKKGGADKAAQEAERVIKESLHAIEEEYTRHTEALRRDYDNEVISSKAYTKGIVDEANDRFEKLKAGLEREKALEKKQSGKDRVDNEIQRAQDARDKAVNDAQDAQDKRERDGLIRHRENLLNLADKYDSQSIASIQATAEARGITYEDAEERIFKIQTDAFDRRLQAASDDEKAFYAQQKDLNDVDLDLAQQYADRIAAIVAEQEGAQLEHERKTDAGRKHDIDNERAYLENMRRMRAQAVADALDIERMEIEAAARNGGSPQTRAERLSIIRALAENERKQEEQTHKDRQAENEVFKTDALARAKTEDERLQALRTYNQLTEQEMERHQLALGQIGDTQKQKEDEQDPLHSLKDIWKDFESDSKNANESIGKSVEALSNTVAGSLHNMVGALRQAYVANLLYGDSIGKALKKALAEQLAEISAECMIQGLKHSAYALGSLAFGDFGGAARHAVAAAAFFGAAAATGYGASSLAKSAGLRGDTSGASAGQAVASSGTPSRGITEGRTGGASDPNVIEQSRNRPPVQPIIIHLEAQAVTRNEPGTLTDHVINVVSTDPRVRVAVTKHVANEMTRGMGTEDDIIDALDKAAARTLRTAGYHRDQVRVTAWE